MDNQFYVTLKRFEDEYESETSHKVSLDTFKKVYDLVDDTDYNPMEEIDRLRYQISCYEKQIKKISEMFQGKGDWYDED